MAGFAGSLLYVAVVAGGLQLDVRFLVFLPTCVLYVIMFFWGLKHPASPFRLRVLPPPERKVPACVQTAHGGFGLLFRGLYR